MLKGKNLKWILLGVALLAIIVIMAVPEKKMSEGGFIPIATFDTAFEGVFTDCALTSNPAFCTVSSKNGYDYMTVIDDVQQGWGHTEMMSTYWHIKDETNNFGNWFGGDTNLILNSGPAHITFKYPVYSKHFRIDYSLSASGLTQPGSTGAGVTILMGSLSGGDSIIGTGASSSSANGLLEIVPSVLDPNSVELFVNGISQGITTIDENTFVEFILSANPGPGDEGSASAILSNPRYKPLFSCPLGGNQLLGMESFAATTELSIFSLRYPVVGFCLDNPVIVTSADGSATTAEPYQFWLEGQTLTVPEGQTWTVFYTLENDGSIPIVCASDEAYDFVNNRCTSASGIIQICSQGVFDPTLGTCVVTPDVVEICPEGGRYDTVLASCVYNPPLQPICEMGVYSSVSEKCEFIPSTEAVCPAGTTWNPLSGFCEMFPSDKIMCDAYFAYDSNNDVCVRSTETDGSCLEGTYDITLDKCVASPLDRIVCSTGTLNYNDATSSYSCLYTPDVEGVCLQGTYDADLDACTYTPNLNYLCATGTLTLDDQGIATCVIEPPTIISCKEGCYFDESQEACTCPEDEQEAAVAAATQPSVVIRRPTRTGTTTTAVSTTTTTTPEKDNTMLYIFLLVVAIYFYNKKYGKKKPRGKRKR